MSKFSEMSSESTSSFSFKFSSPSPMKKEGMKFDFASTDSNQILKEMNERAQSKSFFIL